MKKSIFALLAAVLVALPVTAQPTYVAQAGATFFAGQSATVTQTATVQIPNKSAEGNLQIVTAGITGSPSGCQLAMYSVSNANTTAPAAAEQTQSFSISTGTHAQTVSATSASDVSTDAIKAVYTCSTYPTAGTLTISFAPITTMAGSAVTISTPAQVENYNSTPLDVNLKQVAGTTLGAASNYGTSPGVVKVQSVNAYVTNLPTVNLTQIAGAAPSATNPVWVVPTDGTNAVGNYANYGTSPGAVKVPAVNAFVTNIATVSIATTGDPCQNPNVLKTSVPVAVSSTATTQLVAPNGTKAVYVCGFAASSVGTSATTELEYGTSTACTGTHALTGTVTFATSGYIEWMGGGLVAVTPASQGVCVVTDGASALNGVLTYVQQ